MNVKRANIHGLTEFTFTTSSKDFLVKNFSGDDVYVSFNSEMEINSKVPDMFAESFNDGILHKSIFVNGSGEVEVEQI